MVLEMNGNNENHLKQKTSIYTCIKQGVIIGRNKR